MEIRLFSFFSTFKASPVRELSLQVRPVACKMRPSAAAIPPVSKTRISPGTTLEAGTMQIRPSRRSSVSVDARRFKLSRDLLAF